MSPDITSRDVILFKEESVYGSDPTPTPAANAILAMDLKIMPKGDLLERTPGMYSQGQLSPIIGKRWMEITFGVELRGSGTLGQEPRMGDLLEACGMVEDVQGAYVDYDFTPDSRKSGTLYAYMGSILWIIPGCVGTWELVGDINGISRLNFTLQAPYVDPVDGAFPSGMVYDPRPEPFLSAGFAYDSITTLRISQLQCNINQELLQSEDVNSTHGIIQVTAGKRKPTGSFNPELITKATYDFYAKWRASNAAALTATFGQTAGKKVTLTAPAVTMDSADVGDRGGIRIFDVPVHFGCTTPAASDDIKLRFA